MADTDYKNGLSSTSIITAIAADNADTATYARVLKTPDKNKTSLFETTPVFGTHWDRTHPYKLRIIKKTPDGYSEDKGVQFILPINPQSLDIDMQFAINTSATLGGIIEEHNGAPFRMISLTGTTGILPLRGAPDVVEQFTIPQAIFAGTIQAAAVTANDLIRGFNATSANNLVDEKEFNNPKSVINRTSGFAQFHLLKEFLESYAEKKKDRANADLRLSFQILKENSVYIVTPALFKLSRGADSPNEYKFQLSLKAWARVVVNARNPPSTSRAPIGRDASKVAVVVSRLQAIRGVLENSRKILQAIRGDVNSALFTPLREISLGLRAMSGLAKSMSDLPDNIISDCKESLLTENMSDLRTAIGISNDSNVDNTTAINVDALENLAVESAKANTKDGRNDDTIKILNGPNPANNIFKFPSNYYNLFSKINPDTLKLPPKSQADIRAEAARCQNFGRQDYEDRRNSINSVLEDLSAAIGLGSDTYNNTYSIAPQNTTTKIATEDDIELMYNLNALLIEVNKLCISNRIDPARLDAIQYIAGLASKSGIAFTEPASKFLIPMPYQHTIEQVAALYLGDAERWYEIAALNGLQSPYVDEVGFDVPVATNAVANTIQLSDTTNLFVGQGVFIGSSTIRNESRRITGIQKVSPGVNLVSLSGNPDLNRFTAADQTKIHAYLPNTVNSQMSIYIPSTDPINEEDFELKKIPGVDYFDNLLRVGGISILLTQSNDIAIGADGRTGFAAGLTNIVQKTRIALSTTRGSLFNHPEYGLPVEVGASTADVNPKDVLQSIKDMFSKDPSFSSITSASVLKNGPTTQITVSIGIAGTSKIVPITTEIRR